MKIKKTPVKKLAVPPLPIRNLIKTLKECPEAEIATLVEANSEWTWPRGDLFHWVGVLNRFDEILDNICKSHDMKKPQPKEFTPEERRLVLAILSFSRLLLESCTNRNLYASYEQLNDLLHTRDLDVLESCLRLLLRPAQRHSAQRSAKSIFTVSQDRLLALAHSWGSRDYGLDLQHLADNKAEIPEQLKTLNFQFYRTITPAKLAATDASAAATSSTAAPSTPPGSSSAAQAASSFTHTPAPLKQRRPSTSGASSSITSGAASAIPSTSEGMIVIQVSDPGQLGASDYEILQHLIEEYKVPEEHQFQLLSRIKIATGISRPKCRRQLLIIRILAIAVMSHVLSEAVVTEKFFAFEPEIIQSLTDLIHPDHNIPFDLQTVTLFALDGIAHLRTKQPDVLSAINASASHGVLLYALRKIVAGLDTENVPYPQEFLDAVFALISFIISSATGGNMVISAGIVPILLQLLSNKHPAQLRNVTKSVTILDSLIYGFGTAFSSFCSSGGLNSLVARIKDEVNYSLSLVKEAEASHMTGVTSTSTSLDKDANKDEETSPIPFERTALLKAMFKFVIHMMQSPGTQEGLRNLIDTTLPATLKDIMENPNALGTSVYAHAINTMTSFIHNEPTSLAILQEANIPQTLLASLSKEIPASNDVAMNLPGAFGAICLNPVGLEMFTKEFPIKKFFDIFTSIPHVRAFQDNDIASSLGVSMDELVRHQPTLKTSVMKEIVAMLRQVLVMCSAGEVMEDDIVFCTLQRTRAKDAPPLGEVVEDDAAKDDRKDSLVAQLIEVSARFCESFFQNSSSAKDFLKADGVEILMNFYTLPTLPYDLANTPAFFTLSHLIKLLSETNPGTAIAAVLKEVSEKLAGVQLLLQSTNPGSDLLKFIDISDADEDTVSSGNAIMRNLISLHALSGLISDMFSAPAFSHGRNSASVLAAFVNAHGDKALAGLGQLHRMCVWESIVLKRALQKNWNDPSPRSKKMYNPALVPGTVDDTFEEFACEDKEAVPISPTIDAHTPSAINTKYFKFVLTQIPHYLTPMYQGITKMLFNRRDIEAAQRAHSFQIADSLSTLLQAHISWKRLAESSDDRNAYHNTMIRLLPYLFLDDRNPATLQTIMVVSFVRTGGLEALFSWLNLFWTEASSIQSSCSSLDSEQKELLAKLHGSIEIILSVLQMLTSSKLLLESPHTSPLTSRDDKNRKEDFFEPHEFLVDVRLLVLPRIRTLWMDRQLDRCPAAITRYTIQIITNILKPTGELKPAVSIVPPVIVGTATPNIFGARPLVPDATRVATLLDMGFPRSAAELALTRCGNQLERAAEYLLTHQEVALAMSQALDASMSSSDSGDAPHTQESSNEEASTPAEALVTDPIKDNPIDIEGEGVDQDADMQSNEETKREEEYKAALELHEAHKEELSKNRDEFKPLLVPRSLELMESSDEIIFYVRDLLVLLCKEKDSDVLNKLFKDLQKVSDIKNDQTDSSGKTFGTRLRLLALLFGDVAIQSKMSEHGVTLAPLLTSILTEHIRSQGPQKDNNWLSPLLLMLESFLSLSDEPKVVPDETTVEGKATAVQEDKEMQEEIISSAEKEQLLHHSITLLKQQDLTKDIALSAFRILVRLTRHHTLAMKFLNAGGLDLIFSTLKPERIGVQGQQNFIIMIMRHIIEDTVGLQATIEREIVRWFAQPSRGRTSDIQSYLRHNNFLGLRDLDAFVAGTLNVCKVSKFDSTFRTLQLMSATEITEASRKYTSEISEIVIHFLVSELLSTRTSPPSNKDVKAIEETPNDANFIHRCFLLQCLNELLISYPSCKVDLMNYSRRKGSKDSTSVASKPRASWLGYLLNDLIPYKGTVAQSSETELQKHSIETNFASAVLVAVCSSNDEEEEKKPFNELVQVRRFVIDGIIRSFKDAITSTDPVEIKYGKFLSLSELSYKILGSSSSPGASTKASEDISINIVKVMLEKNFIMTLTNVLADIDLNYPHAKILVNAVLKPLEHLTKLSLKMSRATEPGASKVLRQSTPLSGAGSGAGSGDDADTPDLYRNSSLGMFGANLDSEEDNESGDSAEEDDMFEGEEYEEETASDASDLSEEDFSDDDDADEDLEEVVDRNPFHHHSHEISDEEEDQDDEDMDGDDDDLDEEMEAELQDVLDHDDDEDEEMMEWDADSRPIILREDEIEEVIDGEDEDEDDDGEEDEDVDEDDEGDDDLDEEGDDIVLLDDAEGFDPVRAPGRGGRFSYIEDDDFPSLGAPARNPFLQVSDDVITHPLLAQPRATPASSGADGHRRGGSRNVSLTDWQAFGEFLNGNPSQILGTLMNGGAIRASHGAFRVEVNHGNAAIIAPIERSIPHGVVASDVTATNSAGQSAEAVGGKRVDMFSVVRDFVPYSTSQRWSQECRMMYGATAQDKASRLVNHIVNALIPAAKEEHQAEKARLAEEAAAAEREATRRAEEAAARAARGEIEESEATEVSAMEVEGSTSTATAPEAEPEPAAPARRTVMIDGELVDITDSDIDSEFLEALPEDMRREVYNDYLQSHRPAATATQQPASSSSSGSQAINSDFLDALPANMRTELEEIMRGQGVASNAVEPEPMLNALNEYTLSRLARDILANAAAGSSSTASVKKVVLPRDAIQLVDKSSLATLVRLMFLPQPPAKNILNKLLVNLCENSKTRSELLSLLLSILQDGGADLAAVDKSFAQMSLRGKMVVKAHQHHKSKVHAALPTPVPAAMDNVPNLVARRCFESLFYIVSFNSQAGLFFLAEHDSVTLKRSPSKKGKGKEKAVSSKYPIVLLLDLLERQIFVENAALMEQLMALLAVICRPLATLAKDEEEKGKKNEEEEEVKETELPALKPPVIPDHCVQLIVRVLTAGECSSRTFQYTLSVIQNLSVLEGSKDVITAELVRVARELGAGILEDIETLSVTLANAMSGVDVQGVALENFSPGSSKQAKLLRVLKTIDYMYSKKQSLTPTPAATQDEEKVSAIYDSLSFHTLWTKVGDTLELIRERSDMIHVGTVLLPLIESFMVVCKYVGLRPSTLEVEEAECKEMSNSTEELFLQFTEKHSKILNIMVRNNPALMSGSFSLLVHNPKMLEFDNKRNYFTQQLHKRSPAREHYGTLQMNVRREMVFVDSFSQLQSRTGDEIKYSKLNVHFHGEEGVDAGGVTREWFQVLARQMFNPDYALFKTSAADKLTYQPNRASWVNSDHLLFFKFIGRVIGKAIYDGRLLDAYFTRSFYKHILGRPVDYRDVEAVDPEYYKSLVWMLENDITDIVEETFSMETDDFGNKKVVDLKPNGRNIPVTEENKHEYVKFITEQKLTLAIKDQIHSFLQGFHEIIPAQLISIFNEQELELLISGLPDIDVDEWKNNAEYQNYSQGSPQIQNFWRAVRSFDQTERAKLLQFVTGTSKVPLGGFSQLQGISGVQKFQIHKDFSSTKRLPSAHTCFNQLDLPEYETYEDLRQQLLTAISECSTGFAFA
ncbi:hypothetical protein EDD21DRAFT_320345 [Dissophora ornata]|nr:hypothetical protein EDD21DRAFT_320345 [Dissophora ornata]